MYGYNNYGFNNFQQPIQNVTQQTQSQASCYFVKTPEELAGLNIMPNVFYLGINRDNKEVYIRRMNNDGNIEVEKYIQASGVKEKTELQTIIDRLNRIEHKLAGPQRIGGRDESDTKSADE